VSRFNARDFGHLADKITVIHGGVDPARFAPLPGARRARRALYVGRLIPYKGLEYLIRGVGPETELRLAGAGYHDDYVCHLEHLARGRNVRFLGPILGQDLRREFGTAGALVLPSVEVDRYGKRYPKSEILGLVLLEAMACETPVVCSRIGGMPELVVDGVTGILVPPADEAALGAAVEGLLDDPARARRLGEAGRAHVLANFTWRRVAERCLDAYRATPLPRPTRPRSNVRGPTSPASPLSPDRR
jgi:glycosyltransferase involved in cell wall biosynthesis